MTTMLPIVGTTPEGIFVVTGVYKFFETHGLPLDVLFALLKERNRMPCWLSLYNEARAAGMQHDRILSKIDPAIVDVFGPEFRDKVLATLERVKGPFKHCKLVIPGTFIMCGERNGDFQQFCSDECLRNAKEKGNGNAR